VTDLGLKRRTIFRNHPDDERIRALKAMKLFKGLTSRELREVEQLLHERKYLKDEIIFDKGRGPRVVYYRKWPGPVSSPFPTSRTLPRNFVAADFFGGTVVVR